jgi:hypothetical protein
MPKKAGSYVHKYEWLLIILAIIVLIRIPSWFEPYWYGDEAIYLTIGQALRKGVQLYSQIHDNKPPFLYLMAAVANGNLFWFKFLATAWNLATITVFYKLAEKFCENKRAVVITTGVFALLTTWPKLEGNIANAELFFLLPTVTAVYLLWGKKTNRLGVFTAGLFFGTAALFKMPAVLEAGVWPFLWLVFGDKEWWRKTLILAAGAAIPITLSLFYYWTKGALSEYLVAAWVQNIPYLSSWKAASSGTGIYSLKGRIVLLFLLSAPILGWARKIGRRGVMIGMWGLIALFASLLSGRPYPHYMLQGAGVLALSLSLIIRGRKPEKAAGIIVPGLFFAAALTFHFYNYQTISYYGNFVKWVLRQKTANEYFAWFDNPVNNNYEISSVIANGSTENDKVFVWGDVPMIYALTGRSPVGKYIVKYHIKDFHAELPTMEMLNQEPPKYVVSFGDEEELPGFSSWLVNYYKLQKTVGRAEIYRLSILGGKYN